MLPMNVTWSSSGSVMTSQGERAILAVFFPIYNALYSIAFGTHTKTAEPIEMPFGMMSKLGLRNSVLLGGGVMWQFPKRKWQFLGKACPTCPTSLTPLWIVNWTGPCSGVHMTARRLIASVWVYYWPRTRGLHTADEVWYLRLHCLSVAFCCHDTQTHTGVWQLFSGEIWPPVRCSIGCVYSRPGKLFIILIIIIGVIRNFVTVPFPKKKK